MTLKVEVEVQTPCWCPRVSAPSHALWTVLASWCASLPSVLCPRNRAEDSRAPAPHGAPRVCSAPALPSPSSEWPPGRPPVSGSPCLTLSAARESGGLFPTRLLVPAMVTSHGDPSRVSPSWPPPPQGPTPCHCLLRRGGCEAARWGLPSSHPTNSAPRHLLAWPVVEENCQGPEPESGTITSSP